MKKQSIALFVLALAACKQPGNNTLEAVDNQVGATEAANAQVALPPSEQGTGPTSNDRDAATLPNKIPANLQGRWGINNADCTSTRGDAKGLLSISDTQLTFYESRGVVDQVLDASATSFDARYDFAGEGQTWKRTERLSLENDKLRRRTDSEAGQEPPVDLTYGRCGA